MLSSGAEAAANPTHPAARQVGLEIMAHVQNRGDLTGPARSWVGDDEAAYWVEGLSITVDGGIDPYDLMCRTMLFDGSISSWAPAGEFCGTRGQAHALLGFQVQLRGAAKLTYDCCYGAIFVDGTRWDPSTGDTMCVSATWSAIAAIWIDVQPKAEGNTSEPTQAPNKPATKIPISGGKSFDSIQSEFSIFRREASPRRKFPIPAYPGQDYLDIAKGYNGGSPVPLDDFQKRHPVQVDIHMIENGYFCVGTHLDGLILDNNFCKIEETSAFCKAAFTSEGFDLSALNMMQDEIDQAFISFDAAWGNYFHFLSFALSRAHVADFYIENSCKIVIPEYGNRLDGFVPTYSKATYDRAIALAGLQDRITTLPAGIYPCKQLYFMGSNPRGPTEFCEIPQFYHVFSKIRTKLQPSDKFSRRILISRKFAADQRLSEADYEFVRSESLKAGYQELYLEQLSFQDQVDAFFNAESVIAPHGAGLANLLFGRSSLGVLELAREIDGNGSVRACFFQLASMLGQKYVYLNSTKGDLAPEKFKAALRLISSNPE